MPQRGIVGSITIRNLGEFLKARLRMQVSVHSRFLADEARDVLLGSRASWAH